MRWVVLLVVTLVLTVAARGQVSPFTAVDFEDDGRVMVVFEGERVELASLGGVPIAELCEGSRRAFGDRWQKRIGEDLLDVFESMGVGLSRSDAIDVEFIRRGELVVVRGARMTEENRRAVWRRNQERVRPELRREAERRVRDRESADPIGALVDLIRERHAYAALRGLDLEAVAAAERAGLGSVPSASELSLAAQRIVCALGDGHAGVRDWRDGVPQGYMPTRFARARGGIVAFVPDRSSLMDAAHPFIESIDGVPIEDWIGVVSPYVPAGSVQQVEARSLFRLENLAFARSVRGEPERETVVLGLRDAAGASRVSVEVRLTGEAHSYVGAERPETGVLDGGIGYIRLARMRPRDGVERGEWASALRRRFRSVSANAKGLIIDVRDNGGGMRDPILALLPCVMRADAEPVVVNVARYRLGAGDDPDDPDGYLENRFLYPMAWEGWSDAERAAIERFDATFEPRWEVPEDLFSGWHYMVVSPGGADVPRFDGPVVVLMDEGCFSATDIFLAAFGAVEGVTLVGTASSGGSARSRTHAVGPWRVRLATMVSYQPDGRLFDGEGVQPDVRVERLPGDVLLGGGDAQLDRAMAVVSGLLTP